jgi:hypothetical protein
MFMKLSSVFLDITKLLEWLRQMLVEILVWYDRLEE